MARYRSPRVHLRDEKPRSIWPWIGLVGFVALIGLGYSFWSLTHPPRSTGADRAQAATLRETGLARYAAGEYQQAAQSLREAYEIDPSLPGIALPLGVSLRKSQQFDAAQGFLQNIIKSDPKNIDARFELGMVYLQRGAHEQARETFEAVLRLEPTHRSAPYSMNLALVRLGRDAEATSYLEKHQQLDLSDDELDYWQKESHHVGPPVQAVIEPGRQHLESRDFQSAIAILEPVVIQYPNLWQAHFYLGQAYRETSQWEKAAEAYRQAVRLNGRHFESWFFWGMTHLELKQMDLAEEEFIVSKQLREWDGAHYYSVGVAYHRNGLTERAKEALETSLRLNPTVAPAHYQLGLVLLTQENPESARNAFDAAIRLDAKMANAYVGRAVASAGLHQSDEMESSVQKALELNRLNQQANEAQPSALATLFGSYPSSPPVLRRYEELWQVAAPAQP
jgi:tetratricopeptide (TPR) repeat protein